VADQGGEREREQSHHAEVEAGADHGRQGTLRRETCVRRRRAEKRLTEEEGAEGDDLGEHEHDGSEDEHLGEK
jgi:hypothetical protein